MDLRSGLARNARSALPMAVVILVYGLVRGRDVGGTVLQAIVIYLGTILIWLLIDRVRTSRRGGPPPG